MEWVNIENRLPKEGTWVLAFSRNQIEILFMDSNQPVFWLKNGDWDYEVTHWIPLPEPPNKTVADVCAKCSESEACEGGILPEVSKKCGNHGPLCAGCAVEFYMKQPGAGITF